MLEEKFHSATYKGNTCSHEQDVYQNRARAQEGLSGQTLQ